MKAQVFYEATPNPQAMKFVLDRQVCESQHQYREAGETLNSPLAAKIFGFPWAQGVFIDPHFVTITKQEWVDWQILADPLASLIAEHLDRGEKVVEEQQAREAA